MTPKRLNADRMYVVRVGAESMLMPGRVADELRDLLDYCIRCRPDPAGPVGAVITGKKYRPRFRQIEHELINGIRKQR